MNFAKQRGGRYKKTLTIALIVTISLFVLSLARDKLYDLSLATLKEIGKVKKQDKANSEISAEVDGANITLKLKQISLKKTDITIAARKMMLPKPEIASGVLYRITQKLK